MDKKTVVVLRREILPYSETFIIEQMKALKMWNPILIGMNRMEKGLDLDGVDFHIFPRVKDSVLQRWLTKTRDFFWIKNTHIKKYIKSFSPKIIHVHFGTDAVYYWKSIKNLNVPIIITLHGYDINIYKEWWEQGKGGSSMKKYPQRLLEIALDPNVRFIAVSQAIKLRAIEYGIDAKKIDVSYIGVDTTRFFPAGLPIVQRKKRVLFVGRMVEKKAPLLLIQAFAKVLECVPDAELVMVGDGPLKQQVESLSKEMKLNVKFTGALSTEQVLEQIHKARVFCLPSIIAKNGDAEGLPISIVEAQACGVPVVTSASGAVDEAVIHQCNGLCFKENDIKALSEMLTHLLSDDEMILKFSRNATALSGNFSNARMADLFEEIISCVAELPIKNY